MDYWDVFILTAPIHCRASVAETVYVLKMLFRVHYHSSDCCLAVSVRESQDLIENRSLSFTQTAAVCSIHFNNMI